MSNALTATLQKLAMQGRGFNQGVEEVPGAVLEGVGALGRGAVWAGNNAAQALGMEAPGPTDTMRDGGVLGRTGAALNGAIDKAHFGDAGIAEQPLGVKAMQFAGMASLPLPGGELLDGVPAAKAAAQTLVPGMVMDGSRTGAALQLGLGTAIPTAITAAVDRAEAAPAHQDEQLSADDVPDSLFTGSAPNAQASPHQQSNDGPKTADDVPDDIFKGSADAGASQQPASTIALPFQPTTEASLADWIPSVPAIGNVIKKLVNEPYFQIVTTALGTATALRALGNVHGNLADKAEQAVQRANGQDVTLHPTTQAEYTAKVVDPQAVLYEAVNKNADTIGVNPQDLNAQIHLMTNSSARSSKYTQVFETGEHPDSNVNFNVTFNGDTVTPKEFFASILPGARASAPDKFQDALTALRYGDEIDNRTAMNARWLSNSKQGPQPTGYNFTDMTTQDLVNEYNTLKADPAVAAIIDTYRQLDNRVMDFGVDRGLATPQLVADFRNARPNHVAFDEADKSPFAPRALPDAGGVQSVDAAADPFNSLGSRMVRMFRMADENDVKRIVADFADQYQRADPNAPQMIDKIVTDATPRGSNSGASWSEIDALKNDPGTQNNTVSYYDKGVRKAAVFHDPLYVSALNGNPQVASSLWGGLNSARRFAQDAWIGNVALAFGKFFAPSAAMMEGTIGNLTRPDDMRFGIPYVTRLDPTGLTWMPSAANALVRDLSASISNGIGHTLRDQILNDGWLTKVIPAPRLQAIADSAHQAYMTSALYQQRSTGAAGANIMSPGNMGVTYRPNTGAVWDSDTARSVLSQVASQYNAGTGPLASLGKGVHVLLDVVHNINDLVTNAPRSAYFRANMGRGFSDEYLASAVRRFGGEMSQYGSSPTTMAAVRGSPFLNATIQGGFNLGEWATRNPKNAAQAWLYITTLSALVPFYEAMQLQNLPQEYYDYDRMRSPDDLMTNIKLYGIGHALGLPPEAAPNIPTQYDLAWARAFGRNFMWDMMGLNDRTAFTPEGQVAWRPFQALIDRGKVENYMSGLNKHLSIEGNPLITAGAALAGKDISPVGSFNYNPGLGATNIEDDTLSRYNSLLPAGLETAVRSMAGIGNFVMTALTAMNHSFWGLHYEHGMIKQPLTPMPEHSAIDSIKIGVKDAAASYAETTAQQGPWGRAIWGVKKIEPTGDPVDRFVSQALSKMKDADTEWSTQLAARKFQGQGQMDSLQRIIGNVYRNVPKLNVAGSEYTLSSWAKMRRQIAGANPDLSPMDQPEVLNNLRAGVQSMNMKLAEYIVAQQQGLEKVLVHLPTINGQPNPLLGKIPGKQVKVDLSRYQAAGGPAQFLVPGS